MYFKIIKNNKLATRVNGINYTYQNYLRIFISIVENSLKSTNKIEYFCRVSFLYPSFLLALATLAIPIIIHLFNFRRYKKVLFTNIKFLKDIQEETSSRSKLKHLLVLLARLLTIVALVLAFAQPFIPNKNTLNNNNQPIASIYIDNSFSMESKIDELSLLDKAKEKATEIINAYPKDSRIQIITNNFEGREQRLISKDDALARINEIIISPISRTISQVYERQVQAMEQASESPHELYILSDLQNNSVATWEDTTHVVNIIPIKASNASNVFIDSIYFITPLQTLGDEIKMLVRVRNVNNDTEQSRQLTLKVNNQIKNSINVTTPADGISIDTISFTVSESGWQKAEISMTDFPITFDDTYYFTFNVDASLKVLIVNQGKENPYLNNAFLADNTFNWSNVHVNEIQYQTIKESSIIILNSLNNIPLALQTQLNTFINTGGSLFIFPADNIDKNNYNTFLSSLSADQYDTYITEDNEVTFINTNEPEYKEVFEKLSTDMDLPIIRKHYTWSTGFSNKVELLRMKSGIGLINKYTVGNGKLYLSAVPCNETASSLPLSAVFVPLIYRTGIISKSSASFAYILGNDENIIVDNLPIASETAYKIKGNNAEIIPAQKNISGDLVLNINNQITQSGLYDLVNNENKTVASFGFNFTRDESQMKYDSVEEIKQLLKNNKVNWIDDISNNLSSLVQSYTQGIQLWKYFLIAALLFLAIEILLLRYWKL